MKRRKSLTLISAIKKYNKQREKIASNLSIQERNELEKKLKPFDEELKKYKRISRASSVVQALLGAYFTGYLIVTRNVSVESGTGIGGLHVTKINNGYNGRQKLKQAYNILKEYNHNRIFDDYDLEIVGLPSEEELAQMG